MMLLTIWKQDKRLPFYGKAREYHADDINMKINFDQDCKSRNLKNEADVIAKRLLENKLAISLCQNLSYYSIITNKKPSRK